jgi:hypothetical protein
MNTPDHLQNIIAQQPKTAGQICMDARQAIENGVPSDQAYEAAFQNEAARMQANPPPANRIFPIGLRPETPASEPAGQRILDARRDASPKETQS